MIAPCRVSACAVFASALASNAVGGSINFTVDVELNAPDGFVYTLLGQSAFITTRPFSFTTSNLLDNITSPGAGIGFGDVFPEPSLHDYHSFGYFGILETRMITGELVDTSLIVAFAPGMGVGSQIQQTLPAHDEATLVNAFTTQFDSSEFFDTLFAVVGEATLLGDIAAPPIGRPGETMDLIAFIGGDLGVEGVDVGDLTVAVIPAPGFAAVLGLGVLASLRRRR